MLGRHQTADESSCLMDGPPFFASGPCSSLTLPPPPPLCWTPVSREGMRWRLGSGVGTYWSSHAIHSAVRHSPPDRANKIFPEPSQPLPISALSGPVCLRKQTLLAEPSGGTEPY